MVSKEPLDLKGPKAKNYKPWEDRGRSQDVVAASTSDREKVTGPKAKNAQPWNHRDDSTYVASDKKKNDSDKKEASGKEE